MSMTVRRMITALKKMPPNAKVVVADHDHDTERGECNGSVRRIADAPTALKERGFDVVIEL